MPNWKKVIVSGADAELATLKLTGTSAQNSETDVLTINGSSLVGTRQLGSNAFTSTTIPTNNNQLDNGAGYTTNTGTVTSVATGTGLDGSFSTSGTITLDLSELTDMTATVVPTTDEIILLDNGAERRKRFSEIFGSNAYTSTTIPTNNNQLDNGAGYITSYTDTNTVDMGDGFQISNSSGEEQFTVIENEEIRFAGSGATSVAFDAETQKVTISSTDNNTTYSVGDGGLTQKNFTTTLKNKLDGIASGATNVTNNNQLDNGAGYITSYTDTNTTYSAGSLLDLSSTTFNVDLSELTDMTQAWVNTSDEFVVLDSGVQKRKLGSEIFGSNAFTSTTIPTNNNQLDNGAGYITSYVNTVDMGDGFQISNSSGEEQFTVIENEEIRFAGSGATSVSFDAETQKVTISSTDTNTDTNTVTSIRRDNTGTYRTGNINLIGGTNVSISETSTGVFNISSTDTNTQLSEADVRNSFSAGSQISIAENGTISLDETFESSAVTATNGSSNRVATFNNSNTINGESNLTYDGTYLMMGSTGRIRAGNGSSSAPSYSWTNNTDTGFYLYNNHDILINVDGANRGYYYDNGHKVFGALGVNVNASATDGRIDASNDIVAYSSDKRLKENIKLIENPLDKLDKLSGFTYNWNEKANEIAGFDKEESMVGVFAQDVESVLPEAVKRAPFDNDGKDGSKSGENYLTVQYEKLVPLLIESIKELKSEIEELKKGK